MKIIKEKGNWTFYEFWRESIKFRCVFGRRLFNPLRVLRAYKEYNKSLKQEHEDIQYKSRR